MTEDVLAELERLWATDLTERAIAQRLGYSKAHVDRVVCQNRDRFPYRSRPATATERQWAIEMAGTMTVSAIALSIGVTQATVYNWMKEDNERKADDDGDDVAGEVHVPRDLRCDDCGHVSD